MSETMLEVLARRRSVKPAMLTEPAPAGAELDRLLTIAARVPDHKKLAPWRFIVFEGTARAKIGEVFAAACAAEDKSGPSEQRLEMERGRFLRAPLVVAVISSPKPSPGAPEWEQILSAGAVAYNLCLAANAAKFGTCWITEWVAYSQTVRAALHLEAAERVAGFVYIGTARETPEDRERPDLAKIVTRWEA